MNKHNNNHDETHNINNDECVLQGASTRGSAGLLAATSGDPPRTVYVCPYMYIYIYTYIYIHTYA